MCVISDITEPGLTKSSGISDHLKADRSDQLQNPSKSLFTCAEGAVPMENSDHNICQTVIVR